MSATGMVSSDGSSAQITERLCGDCFEADHAALDAYKQEVRERLVDGSIFEQLRGELATVTRSGDAGALAHAAEFIDLLVANLDVPVPEDLRAFADRHRQPAA